MTALPAGPWTTYGDLAQVIGTDAQPVGNHILACSECVDGQRVLIADGRPNANFRWTDPGRTDDPRQLLEREGVRFDESGHADPGRRMTLAELRVLATGDSNIVEMQ